MATADKNSKTIRFSLFPRPAFLASNDAQFEKSSNQFLLVLFFTCLIFKYINKLYFLG